MSIAAAGVNPEGENENSNIEAKGSTEGNERNEEGLTGGSGAEIFTEGNKGNKEGSTGGNGEGVTEGNERNKEGGTGGNRGNGGRIVGFPVPSARTDGAELLDELERIFKRYVILPAHAAEVLALWTLHTYASQLRSVTTYLGVLSPKKRCGKTTLLTLLDKLVSRPEFASNISPPAIFRAIEENQPTLLIDEGDTFLKGKDELRGILNAGYTRESAYVLRATGEGQALRRFSCWCPKVIASIGRLPETLADRCVIINMRRKTPAEKCERLRPFDTLALYDRCRRWVAENETKIPSAQPDIPAGLNDRAADIWEPLLVLADLAGGRWPQTARTAALSLNSVADEQDVTSLLLADIQTIFRVAGVDKLFSRYLVEALTKIAERPWREIRRGGAINELWLAQHLGAFGIHSTTMRIGVCTGKGYLLEDFEDAFARYVGKGKEGGME